MGLLLHLCWMVAGMCILEICVLACMLALGLHSRSPASKSYVSLRACLPSVRTVALLQATFVSLQAECVLPCMLALGLHCRSPASKNYVSLQAKSVSLHACPWSARWHRKRYVLAVQYAQLSASGLLEGAPSVYADTSTLALHGPHQPSTLAVVSG